MANSIISKSWDNDYALLLFIKIIMALVGVGYMAAKGIQTGYIYVTMFLIGVGILFMGGLLLKNDMKRVTQFIKVPFVTSSLVAAIAYIIGRGLPILLYGVSNVFNLKLQVYELSLSVWGKGIISGQTFAAAQIESSPAWTLFNLELTAGTIETFFYNFALVVAGVLIGYWIVSRFVDDNVIKRSAGYKALIMLIAFSLSMLIFAGSHALNDNYVGWMYVAAAIFLAVSNMTIYWVFVPLMFWLGYHESNNLVAYAAQFGWAAVGKGYLSWYGILSVGVIILTIFFILRKSDKIGDAYSAWRRRNKSL